MLLRLTLLCSILFCSLPIAHADDASKQAKVQEFFKVARLDQISTQMIKQAMDMMNSGMLQRMTGVKLSPDKQPAVDQLDEKMAKIVSGALSWDALEPDYAKLYASTYTEQQLDDIIAFYKSPTGQAMLDKTPELMQQSRVIAMQRLTAVMPQIRQMAKDFAAQQTTTTHQATPKQ